MVKVITEVFERYPQIGLPIMKGAKETEVFRRTVLSGVPAQKPVEHFIGDTRATITTAVAPAGEVAVLYLYHRADFENAIRYTTD